MRGPGTLVLFLAASVTFGTAFVGIKAGLAYVPPVLFAAFRYDIGAVLLLSYVLTRRSYAVPRSRHDVVAVVVAGVFLITVNGVLTFVGQQFIPSGGAAIMFSLAPVIAPVLALVALPGDRIDLLGGLGIVLGLFGVAVIVGPGAFRLADGSAVGYLLVGGAATSVAFGSVLLRRLDPALPSLTMTAWGMALAAVAVHATSLALGESPGDVTATLPALLAVLYVGVPSTAIAFPSYFGLIERAGPIRANLITYVVPAVAAVTGAVVLGEALEPRTVLGFLVIVGGFVLVERTNLRREVDRLRARVEHDPAADEHVCEPMPRG